MKRQLYYTETPLQYIANTLQYLTTRKLSLKSLSHTFQATRMKKQRYVAVPLDVSDPFDRQIIRGIAKFVQETDHWNLYLEEKPKLKLPDMKSWKGDGIIANFDDAQVAERISKIGIPIVGFGGGYGSYKPDSGIPYFRSDNRAIAHLAAEHLIDCGLKNFGYCGVPANSVNGWSKEREDAFRDYLSERKLPCSVLTGRYGLTTKWRESQEELCKWLDKLPKPVGIFASEDARARHILEACRSMSLRVPEDVAVIGVDNDELICDLTNPSLSSIDQGTQRIGYLAAARLDDLMSKKKIKNIEVMIKPEGVIQRRSTDVITSPDELVTQALALIRERACDPLQIEDLLKMLHVSRTTLENRFKEHRGRSVFREIRKIQLEKANNLLSNSGLTLKEVAHRCGFNTIQYMTTIFRKEYNQTPAEIRKQHLFYS